MESLARGLSAMRAFGGGRAALSGADVAAITGLSRAAARRCLHTLAALGYARVRDGIYELTPAVLSLAQAYLGSSSLASLAQPVLDRVSAQIEEASAVAVLDADDVVFLARVSARRILSVNVSIGTRLPASCTASGRVLLACGDTADTARYVARVQLSRLTARTIVDRNAFAAELDRVRATGYAIVDQELEVGLRSIAVPIRWPDGAVAAALNVGVQTARVDTRTLQREILPVLQQAAGEIGAAIRGTR